VLFNGISNNVDPLDQFDRLDPASLSSINEPYVPPQSFSIPVHPLSSQLTEESDFFTIDATAMGPQWTLRYIANYPTGQSSYTVIQGQATYVSGRIAVFNAQNSLLADNDDLTNDIHVEIWCDHAKLSLIELPTTQTFNSSGGGYFAVARLVMNGRLPDYNTLLQQYQYINDPAYSGRDVCYVQMNAGTGDFIDSFVIDVTRSDQSPHILPLIPNTQPYLINSPANINEGTSNTFSGMVITDDDIADGIMQLSAQCYEGLLQLKTPNALTKTSTNNDEAMGRYIWTGTLDQMNDALQSVQFQAGARGGNGGVAGCGFTINDQQSDVPGGPKTDSLGLFLANHATSFLPIPIPLDAPLIDNIHANSMSVRWDTCCGGFTTNERYPIPSSYVLEFSTAKKITSQTVWQTAYQGSDNNVIVDGLNPYTVYTFRVTMVTDSAAPQRSPASAMSKARTLADFPGTPTNAIASQTYSTYLIVDWTAPSYTGGAPIQKYKIQHQKVGANGKLTGSVVTHFTPGAFPRARVYDLQPSTTYHFWLFAQNAGGLSQTPLEFQLSTVDMAPRIIAITANDPVNADNVYGAGDTITVTFSTNTNYAGTNPNGIISQASINSFLSFYNVITKQTVSIGKTYTGRWNNAHELLITIQQPADSTPAVGQVTAKCLATGNLLNSDATSNPCRFASYGALLGNWGTANLIDSGSVASVQQKTVVNHGQSLLLSNIFTFHSSPLAAGQYRLVFQLMNPISDLTQKQFAIVTTNDATAILDGNTIQITADRDEISALIGNIQFNPIPLHNGQVVILWSLYAVSSDSSSSLTLKAQDTIVLNVPVVNTPPKVIAPTTVNVTPQPASFSSYAVHHKLMSKPMWAIHPFASGGSGNADSSFGLDDADETDPNSQSFGTQLDGYTLSVQTSVAGVAQFPTTAPTSIIYNPPAGTPSQQHTLTGTLLDLSAAMQAIQIYYDVGVADQYAITVTLDDGGNANPSDDDPSVSITDTIAHHLSSTVVIPVQFNCSIAVPPVINSAHFTENGAGFVLELSTAIRPPLGFKCDTLFTADSLALFGNGAECLWTDAHTLFVSFGANPTLMISQSVSIKQGALKMCDETSADYAAPAQSVTVTESNKPVIPSAQIAGPNIADQCADLTLTGIAFNTAGLNTKYSWSTPLESGALITATFTDNKMIIPSSQLVSLTPGHSYAFRLIVTNLFGHVSNSISHAVTIINTPAPQIDPRDLAELFTYRTRPVQLSVRAMPSACVSMQNQQITYSWDIQPALSISSLSSSTLFVPPNTLSASSSYIFTVTASMAANPSFTSSVSVGVDVGRSPLRAIIIGASHRIYRYDAPINLDASLSMDPDDMHTPLSYNWTCTVAFDGTPCLNGSSQDQVFTSNAPFLSLPGGLLAPNLYTFLVRVADMSDSTRHPAFAAVTVTVTNANTPSLDVIASRQIINVNDRLALNALITLPSDMQLNDATYQWGVILSSGALLLSQPDLVQGLGSASIAINPDNLPLWPAGMDLPVFFQLTSSSSQPAASIAVLHVNIPPAGCLLSVSPSQGVELVTDYQFTVRGCRDPDAYGLYDSSLTYQFFRLDEWGEIVWLSSPVSEIDYTVSRAMIPSSTSADHKVTVGVRVVDTNNGITDITTTVVQLPNPASAPASLQAQWSTLSQQAIAFGDGELLSAVISSLGTILDHIADNGANLTAAIEMKKQLLTAMQTASSSNGALLPPSSLMPLLMQGINQLTVDIMVADIDFANRALSLFQSLLQHNPIDPTAGPLDVKQVMDMVSVIDNTLGIANMAQDNAAMSARRRRLLDAPDRATLASDALNTLNTVLAEVSSGALTVDQEQLHIKPSSGSLAITMARNMMDSSGNGVVTARSEQLQLDTLSVSVDIPSAAFSTVAPKSARAIDIALSLTTPNPFLGLGQTAQQSPIITPAVTFSAFAAVPGQTSVSLPNFASSDVTVWLPLTDSTTCDFGSSTCSPVCYRWDNSDWTNTGVTTRSVNTTSRMVGCSLTSGATITALNVFFAQNPNNGGSSSSSTGIDQSLTNGTTGLPPGTSSTGDSYPWSSSGATGLSEGAIPPGAIRIAFTLVEDSAILLADSHFASGIITDMSNTLFANASRFSLVNYGANTLTDGVIVLMDLLPSPNPLSPSPELLLALLRWKTPLTLANTAYLKYLDIGSIVRRCDDGHYRSMCVFIPPPTISSSSIPWYVYVMGAGFLIALLTIGGGVFCWALQRKHKATLAKKLGVANIKALSKTKVAGETNFGDLNIDGDVDEPTLFAIGDTVEGRGEESPRDQNMPAMPTAPGLKFMYINPDNLKSMSTNPGQPEGTDMIPWKERSTTKSIRPSYRPSGSRSGTYSVSNTDLEASVVTSIGSLPSRNARSRTDHEGVLDGDLKEIDEKDSEISRSRSSSISHSSVDDNDDAASHFSSSASSRRRPSVSGFSAYDANDFGREYSESSNTFTSTGKNRIGTFYPPSRPSVSRSNTLVMHAEPSMSGSNGPPSLHVHSELESSLTHSHNSRHSSNISDLEQIDNEHEPALEQSQTHSLQSQREHSVSSRGSHKAHELNNEDGFDGDPAQLFTYTG